MTKMQKFLDSKHGGLLGRVYMLIALFVFNALIPIGAVMYYLYAMTVIPLCLGALGTAATMLVLSTPCSLDAD